MDSRVLISCQNLGYSSQSLTGSNSIEKWDIRDLTLKLRAGDRVHFVFYNNEQKEVLLRLFLKKLKPKTGSIYVSSKIHIYSEYDFWEGTNKKVSLKENMNSKLFASRPWFGGQRKNIDTLIDRLDLSGNTQNIPIHKLSVKQRNRFRALMIIAANTKVILIDNFFSELDDISVLFIKEWLESFSGIVILFGDSTYEKKSGNSIQTLKRNAFESIFSLIVSFSADGFSKNIKFNK